MKKFLFSVVAMATMVFSANAQTWDFTDGYGEATANFGTSTNAYGTAEGFKVIVPGVKSSTWADIVSFFTIPGFDGLQFGIKNSDAAKDGIRQFPSGDASEGLLGNGGDCLLKISNCTAGEKITITACAKGSTAVNQDTFISKRDQGNNLTSTNTASSAKDQFNDFTYTVDANGVVEIYFTNARITKIVKGENSTGVNPITGELCKETGFFNLLGQKLNAAPEKGTYIVTYSDCPAEKFVK